MDSRWTVVLVGLVACSSGERSSISSAAKGTARATVERLRTFPVLAARLAQPKLLAKAKWSDTRALTTVETTLPSHAGGPTRVSVSPSHWLEMRAVGDRAVTGERVDDAIVFSEPRAALDVVLFADRRGFEEIRFFREPVANVPVAYRVKLGPGLASIRLREGVLEALDFEGRARLRSDPWLAVDAGGRSVTATPTLRRDGDEWAIEATFDTAGLAAPVAIDPGWGASSTLAFARSSFTATPLASGKVLVVGGESSGTTILSAVEIYDPPTNTFTLGTSMSVPRSIHTATTLASGKVLIAGGGSAATTAGCQSTAEIYDPATGTWSSAGAFSTLRGAHAAALLSPSGKVLIAGGEPCKSGSGPHSTADVYDPSTNSWTAVTNAMSTQHRWPVAGPAGTDKAIVAGGWPGYGAVSNAEVYDATTNSFVAFPKMSAQRETFAGVSLADGRFLFIAGEWYPSSWTSIASIDAWVPSAGAFSTIAPLKYKRAGHMVTRLSTGKVLVVGGFDAPAYTYPSIAELYDPGTNTWSDSGVASDGHPSGAIVSLGTTALLLGGKASSTYESTADLWADAVAPGTTCFSDASCTTGFCADGVCCDRACTGQCESCNESGSVGTCKLVTGAPRGKRTACAGTGSCAGTCDGASTSCTFPTTAIACKAATCIGGSAVAASYCDGAGSCGATPASTSCGLFACGATACKSTCSVDADCVASAYCEGTTCVSRKAGGAACTSDSACVTGHCADGVCCDTACSGSCDSCNQSGSIGTCTPVADCETGPTDAGSETSTETGPEDTGAADTGLPIADGAAPDPGPKPTVGGPFQRCNHDDECSTGHCVEGVCCDTACNDRCHSCALLTSPGKCTLEPIGVDLKNECGAAFQCVGTCGGDGECVGAGTGTMCARNRCTGPSTGLGPGYCPSPGGICGVDDAVPFDCAPYICEPAFGACRTECNSSSDCANGTICQDKTCITPAPAEDSGGCAFGRPTAGKGSLVALLLVGLGLARRRARISAI
jgi:hypothetical protein